MPNDAFTQQALANDSRFRARLRNALSKVAWEVLEESESVTGHVQRAGFARHVLANLDATAQQIASWVVVRTNVFSFTTSYDFTAGAVVSASGDADIESQLSTDWSHLAGV